MFKQMVIGVLSAVKRMVNGRTQASTDLTQLVQPGASNTSAPTRGGKGKSQVAQVQRQSPARQASSKKRKVAPQTTVAAKSTSKKQKPAQTGKSPSTRGKSTQTPASKTPRHVKSAKKPKS